MWVSSQSSLHAGPEMEVASSVALLDLKTSQVAVPGIRADRFHEGSSSGLHPGMPRPRERGWIEGDGGELVAVDLAHSVT